VNTHRDKPEVRKPDSHFTCINIISVRFWTQNKNPFLTVTECGHLLSGRRGSSHCSGPLLTCDITSCSSATLHHALPSFLCDSSYWFLCVWTVGENQFWVLKMSNFRPLHLYFLFSQLPHRWLESSYWFINPSVGVWVCVHVCRSACIRDWFRTDLNEMQVLFLYIST